MEWWKQKEVLRSLVLVCYVMDGQELEACADYRHDGGGAQPFSNTFKIWIRGFIQGVHATSHGNSEHVSCFKDQELTLSRSCVWQQEWAAGYSFNFLTNATSKVSLSNAQWKGSLSWQRKGLAWVIQSVREAERLSVKCINPFTWELGKEHCI